MTISEYHQEVARALQNRIKAGKVISVHLGDEYIHYEKIEGRVFVTVERSIINANGIVEKRFQLL